MLRGTSEGTWRGKWGRVSLQAGQESPLPGMLHQSSRAAFAGISWHLGRSADSTGPPSDAGAGIAQPIESGETTRLMLMARKQAKLTLKDLPVREALGRIR